MVFSIFIPIIILIFHLRSSRRFAHDDMVDTQDSDCDVGGQFDAPEFGLHVVSNERFFVEDIKHLACFDVESVLNLIIVVGVQVG